ncbi:MAG: hypothetical protein ACFFDN_22505 [Candidatus Hodarchaeota archaeon]
MNAHNNNDQLELEYYMDIIEKYRIKDMNPKETEIWKNKSLIKLMELLEKSKSIEELDRIKNRKLVTNSLILIISLFEDLPPDLFDNQGKDTSELSSEDRDILLSKLKDECLAN